MKTRFVKVDVPLETERDLMKALVDGCIIKTLSGDMLKIAENGGVIRYRKDGSIYPPGTTLALNGSALGNVLLALREDPSQWEEELENRNILCHVGRMDDEKFLGNFKSYFPRIVSGKSPSGEYDCIDGSHWECAVPATIESLKRYLLEDDNGTSD